MASGITDNPMRPASADYPLSVEYTLELSDFDALDRFNYDRVLSRQLRFRIAFYAGHLLFGAILAIFLGMIVGAFSLHPRTEGPSSFLSYLKAICITALSLFAIVLIGLLPKSFFHRIARATNLARLHRARRGQVILGVINTSRHYQVVMTAEWFTETTEYRDTDIAVEVSERKETRVWWSAVASIDVREERAFFTVTDKGYLILPQRAFRDKESFDQFIALARTFHEDARRDRAPVPEPPPPDERITR